jgi:hypothetical protein
MRKLLTIAIVFIAIGFLPKKGDAQNKINIISEKKAEFIGTFTPSSSEIGWPIQYKLTLTDYTNISHDGTGRLGMGVRIEKRDILGEFNYQGKKITEAECKSLAKGKQNCDCSIISTYFLDDRYYYNAIFKFDYLGQSINYYLTGGTADVMSMKNISGVKVDFRLIKNAKIIVTPSKSCLKKVNSLMQNLK